MDLPNRLKDYLEGKLKEEELARELEKTCVSIQKEKWEPEKGKSFVQQLSQHIYALPEKFYEEALPQLIRFAFTLASRGVYSLYIQNG